MFSFRSLLRPLVALLLAGPGLAAFAAAPITGTVTNRTTGKPAGGDEVVLIRLQQGMQESTRSTTDARGHFSLEVPDEGIHLVRVTHQKATYFQPVQPDEHTVAVTVYDAAPTVEGVQTSVQEIHVEATPTELHVVEVIQVMNTSSPQRTQFGPDGYDFYLPKGALVGRTGAITQGGMPVQTPAVPRSDPGHFSFLFPLRPGETQFGIAYTLPYTGKFTFTPRLSTPVKTFAVLLPTAMKLQAGSPALQTTPSTKPGSQTFLAQDVAAGQGPEFTVSGTGALAEPTAEGNSAAGPNASTANPNSNADASAPQVSNSDLAGGRGLNNPLDQSGDRDPWAKYKWWILSGLALLLAVAAGVLLRKPAGGAAPLPLAPAASAPWPPPAVASGSASAVSNHHSALLNALKEEMFALETERLQRHIGETDYRAAKSALELILGRALHRSSPQTDTAQARGNTAAAASDTGTRETALTGRDSA